MKIAILHFHLNTAGVTSVIRQQVAGLKFLGHDVLLLTGQPPPSPINAAVEVVQGLGYDEEGVPTRPIDWIVSDILAAFSRQGWRLPNVLHVHNPLLAKNQRLVDILERLQGLGLALLCQVHDFAEDGRPYAFFPGPYPRDCHYAVINLRDQRILKSAGLLEQGLHYLPNTVTPWPPARKINPKAKETILYPARAIRRKNIGEAILLHYCRHRQLTLVITLPPTSKRDMPAYAMWRSLTADQGVNVSFEAGLTSEFEPLIAQCSYALTTSITEGFGFAFLEPWTGGKLLSGRLLPDVCEDFLNQGLCLDHLYHHLKAPLSWIDEDHLRTVWCRTMRQAVSQYGIDTSEDNIVAGWQRITRDGLMDFGLLDEASQMAILQKIICENEACNQLVALNPTLNSIGNLSYFDNMIEHNNKVINKFYNPHHYASNLERVYHQVADNPVKHQIDKKAVARHFLSPDNFSLLKWRPFRE